MKTPRIVKTRSELKAAIAEANPGSLGFVPTMGALHDGHASLFKAAREENELVVISVFVNELQFNDTSDYAKYPRTLDADVQVAAGAGVDIVFAPEAREIYHAGLPLIRLNSGALGEMYEGASRPGHFDGMLAVVAKLLHLADPRQGEYRAYFGQKDAQQVVLIRRMVADLDYAVELRSVPIVRSGKGLALSSRNSLLNEEQLQAALVLHRAIALIAGRAERNEPLNLDDAIGMFQMEPLVELDYFVVVDPGNLQELAFNCQDTPFTGEGLILVAATVGGVRLIDNQPI
ncbi:pantoate--beta-alanine ligase [Glutamicibacter protophormiae]|uniref:pantoate--beta-alanine ligase n=1 Tax=Glutamicibacter protophormiae TaxID=37930 RepID=UPI002A822D2A|nr:pantoate--beta-alanine ligase [Glutamicibacter protophormiae]WPR64851.1 pantoate--beta-alanine ligase [Glutamicibacter protophormiae]WPR68347.1 pantoate--beta-alanine ligase [Glutamicibacter protophormiae]